jgi:hypothetical protein
MLRPPSFTPARPRGRRPETAKGALDFLRGDDKMAGILPTATRMAALQKDCAAVLPAMFDACAILQFADAQLVLSTPTAALASRLKQQLPKLQESLLKRGWQVNAIRLKVQVGASLIKEPQIKQAVLPERAVSALADLGGALEKTSRNESLVAAIEALVRRHREAKPRL